MTGYVFQDDILMPTLTVRECLMFSANLRLPSCVSTSEKEARVQKAMEDLGISHISERLIGNESTRGISGGEKRRVSIGMELVISPHVLFLDEPTSGLDSYNAFQTIKCLVNLAKKGRTIIFSIHQPRSNIFQQFDEIILINGGDIVYSGPASNAVTHFTNLGHNFPSNTNPADFLIDILTMTPPKPVKKEIEIETIDEYDYGREPNDESISSETYSLLVKSKKMMPYATTFLQQFLILSKRSFYNFIRNFYLMPAHFGSSAILGLLLGGIYWKLGINLQACQNRVGVIFFMLSVLGFGAMSSLELFVSERVIYTRERANGYYRSMAYFLSKILFDIIPLRVIPPIIMGSICYYMIGLRAGINHFFWFIFIMVLFNIVAGGMCLVIASLAPNVAAANVIAIAAILVNTLFGGFLINKNTLPNWLSWLFYLSYWNYSFESLLINEFLGMAILIDPKGVREYPGRGEFILDLFGMVQDSFYPDIIVLGSYGIFFILLSGLMITIFVKEKR